jgi:hypothetical protein
LGIIPTPGMGNQEVVSITTRNPFIHKKPYALKAQDVSAQGNAGCCLRVMDKIRDK